MKTPWFSLVSLAHMQPMVLEYESQHLPHVYDPIF